MCFLNNDLYKHSGTSVPAGLQALVENLKNSMQARTSSIESIYSMSAVKKEAAMSRVLILVFLFL